MSETVLTEAEAEKWANLPSIMMAAGNLTAIVDKAEKSLIDGGALIYQRGGELVRPVRLDRDVTDDGVRRKAGSLVLLSVSETWLIERMSRVALWYTFNKTDKQWVAADPKPAYADHLLARAGEWRFPVLRAVVATPTLAFDGRAIQTPGYDQESGLLLDFVEGEFPPVPENPTREDAMAALALLASPLREMPWSNPASRSVALSALLTALVRGSLRTSPLHAFDAPAAGTGKSKLCDVVGVLKTGAPLPAMSQGKTDDEDEKRLSTVLHAGDPVILIDNCERAITGDFLCSMLTQETVQARILGLSERRVLPSGALVLASGNNLTTAGDTTRRVVTCRIDSRDEHPDRRQFKFDPVIEARERRSEMVVAGLTILRAYRVAESATGQRPAPLGVMGSFEDWGWIREALVWLGEADPADTQAAAVDSDPRKHELAGIMEVWERQVGDAWITVGQLVGTPLEGKFAEVCPGGHWSAKSVGWWLRRNKDRVLGNRSFQFREGSSRSISSGWRLQGAQRLEGLQGASQAAIGL